MKYAIAVLVVLACAFGYHQFTKPSSHDQAVAYMKDTQASQVASHLDSVTCTATAEPAYLAQGYGPMTLFNCSGVDPATGKIIENCIATSGKALDQFNAPAMQMGGPTCAEWAKTTQNLAGQG